MKQLRREGEPCEVPPPAEQPKPAPKPAATQAVEPAKPVQTPAKPNSQSTTPAVSERGPPTPAATNPPATVSKTFAKPPPGELRIRNMHLAGKKHPITGVPFDMDGFPDFRAAGVVKQEVKIIFTGDHPSDVRAANKAANLKATPNDYTWHHHQDGTTMQLVPTKIHRETGHTGGMALMRTKP